MTPPALAPTRPERTTDSAKASPIGPSRPSRAAAPPSGRALDRLGVPATRLSDRDPATPSGLDPIVERVVRAPGLGEPLLPAIRARLEQGLGVDLAALRVHTGAHAAAAAGRLGARAFTVGRRVFLGARATVHDTALLAHEAAHAVQQQSAPAVQTLAETATSSGALESEAASAGHAVAGGGSVRIEGRAGPGTPQHDDEEPGFIERTLMGLVRSHAPWLVPIIEKGPAAWLMEQVSSALQTIVDTVMAPVRAVTATIAEIREHVGRLITWMVEIGGQLAKGDCSGLIAAADKIAKVAEGLASPAIQKITEIATKVADFFKGLWASYGAPAWEWLSKAAGRAWEAVKNFAVRLWDSTKPVRDWIGRAWTWLLNKLGIDTGTNGESGLLDWIKRKAGEAWDKLKAKLEPYKKALAVVAGVLLLLSPVGPIIAVAAAGVALVQFARWIAKTFSRPDGVVRERREFIDRIAPGIKSVTGEITKAVSRGAALLVEKLTAVVDGLKGAAGSLADSLLSFLVTAANWLLARFQELLAWAVDKVNGFVEKLTSGLKQIGVWLQPVLRVLDKVGRVLENILELAILLAEKAWNAVPACIRDPVTNFLVEHLLKKIPILKEILEVPDVWAKIKDLARTVIRKIFRGGFDIAGAALAIFKFLLEVLKVPLELVLSIFKKAGAAIDVIVDKPVVFLKNLLRGVAKGFKGFWDNGLKYLLEGVIGWIVGQLPSGVRAPIPFTVGNVFRFVLDVLGITMERVWKVIQRNVPDNVYRGLRAAANALATAWDWLQTAITEGPAGLWKRFTDKINELTGTVVEAIAGYLFERVVVAASKKLLALVDPTGIMAVVNSILLVYDTIRSVVEYLARILAIIDDYLSSVLDIAAGSIDGAALRIEKLLAKAVPVAIGFLANAFGISGLANQIRVAIAKLQDWVESGIEKLVKAAVKVGGSLVKMIGKLFKGRDLPEHRFKEKDGHEHVIAFPRTGTEPTVASDEAVGVRKYIEINDKTALPAAEKTLQEIAAAVGELDKILPPDATPEQVRAADGSKVLKLQQAIRDKEAELAKVLVPIFDAARKKWEEGAYHLEGKTGEHGKLQFRGDLMDADHQPHSALLKAMKKLKLASDDVLFPNTTRLGMSDSSIHSHGMTILLGLARHKAGRTHSSKANAVTTAGLDAVKQTRKLTDKPELQRAAVVAALRASMQLDVLAMRDVILGDTNWADAKKLWPDDKQREAMVAKVRENINAGLGQIQRQPLDEYLT